MSLPLNEQNKPWAVPPPSAKGSSLPLALLVECVTWQAIIGVPQTEIIVQVAGAVDRKTEVKRVQIEKPKWVPSGNSMSMRSLPPVAST